MICQSVLHSNTGRKNKKNQGFSLVEMVIIVTIFAILLGILVPSLNSVLGFEAQRATQSICASLDKTRREAMSRLVGEMELYYDKGGYFVKYHLDRGKGSGLAGSGSSGDSPEQVAKSRVLISYKDSAGGVYDLKAGEHLILTYNREHGGFRPIQTAPVGYDEMQEFLKGEGKYQADKGKDLVFPDSGVYCTEIMIECGMRKRTIVLDNHTGVGSYTVRAY